MMVGSVSGSGSFQAEQPAAQQMNDSVSAGLQKQIAAVREKIQSLADNEDMPVEQKIKKRQELQQQINDLNNQLRQHQIELRKQGQQKSGGKSEDVLGAKPKENPRRTENGSAGFSQATMQAMVSAESSMKLAESQHSVKTALEGRLRVLGAEIKLDGARGGDTERKQGELSDIESRIQSITTIQMDLLSEAGEEMKEASAEDSEESEEETSSDDKSKPEPVMYTADGRPVVIGEPEVSVTV